MNFYNGSVNYNNKPTLWQQAMMSKKQEQELYNFLSIGCGGRCRGLSKQLNLALQKKSRNRVIKIMRKIGLDKGFAGKIARLLEGSGLTLEQQRVISKQIKRILLDFKRGVHSRIDLRGIKLSQLPLSLRRFVIALIVLKAEIVNLFRLYLEGLAKIREKNNAIKLSIDDRSLKLNDFALNIDNHKSCSSGVSLSKGRYDGMMDIFFKKDNRQKTTFKDTDINKCRRNKEQYKQSDKNKYYNDSKNFNDRESEINKKHFYQEQKEKNYF